MTSENPPPYTWRPTHQEDHKTGFDLFPADGLQKLLAKTGVEPTIDFHIHPLGSEFHLPTDFSQPPKLIAARLYYVLLNATKRMSNYPPLFSYKPPNEISFYPDTALFEATKAILQAMSSQTPDFPYLDPAEEKTTRLQNKLIQKVESLHEKDITSKDFNNFIITFLADYLKNIRYSELIVHELQHAVDLPDMKTTYINRVKNWIPSLLILGAGAAYVGYIGTDFILDHYPINETWIRYGFISTAIASLEAFAAAAAIKLSYHCLDSAEKSARRAEQEYSDNNNSPYPLVKVTLNVEDFENFIRTHQKDAPLNNLFNNFFV